MRNPDVYPDYVIDVQVSPFQAAFGRRDIGYSFQFKGFNPG